MIAGALRVVIALAALLELAFVRLLPESGPGLYARLAAATVVVLLPGGLICDALNRRSASATLVWSLASLTVALVAVFATGSSLSLALWVLAGISVAALAVSIARRLPRPPRIGGSAIAAAAGALFGIALWHVAGPVDGDALFHLARVRKLAAFDELSLHAVNEFADGGLHPGYAFPLWHAFLAVVAQLAGVDPQLVVLHEASVLAPLAFLVVYEAGTMLFRSGWLGGGVVAANTALIALAPGHGGAFASLALPATSSRQLIVPAVLTLVFTQLREPSAAVLAGIGAGALTLTLVHPSYTVFLGVPLAGFLLVRALWDRRDALRLGAAAVAYAVPTGAALLWLLPIVRETASHNPSRGEVRRALEQYPGQLEVLRDGSYRLGPELFSRSGAVAVAALALIPLAGLAGRRRWASFVLGGSVAVLVVMLLPELFTRLSDATSISQSRRLAGFLPFAFAVAGGAAVLARLFWVGVVPLGLVAGIALQRAFPGDFTLKIEGGGGPERLTWFALVGGLAGIGVTLLLRVLRRRGVDAGREWLAGVAVILFALPVAAHAARNWSPSPEREASPLTPGLVRALREHVSERAVVFSDPQTSYRIGAELPVYVAVNPETHVAATKKNRPYERRDDALRFFRKGGDLAIPRRYRAGWLVVDRKEFKRVRVELRPVYEDDRYELYRLRARR